MSTKTSMFQPFLFSVHGIVRPHFCFNSDFSEVVRHAHNGCRDFSDNTYSVSLVCRTDFHCVFWSDGATIFFRIRAIAKASTWAL